MFSAQGLTSVRKLSSTHIYYKKAKFDFGLDNLERSHLKRRLSEAYQSLFKKHIYKTALNVQNKYELADLIINNEIFNQGGLIALPKPFGIGRKKADIDKKTVTQTLNSAANISETSIQEVIPLLKKHYGTEELDVLFFPEKYMSGIMLLSLSNKVSSIVHKCFRRSLGLQQPNQSYWVVSLGKPVPESTQEKVCIGFHYVPNLGKIPIIKGYSRSKVKTGALKANVVNHSLLAYNDELDVALVEMNVLNIKHHFLRLWMSQCYAPLLGDLIYGGRVKSVMGKKILVSPNNISGYQPPGLSENLLMKLYLNYSQVELIPVHIHQEKLKLFGFFGRTNDLILTAPPPDYFLWSCFQLSLLDEETEDSFDPNSAMDFEEEMWEQPSFSEVDTKVH